MSVLFAISLTTGILSALWGWVAISLGLITWAGFLGCTTYFAAPKEGLQGLGLSILTNLSGVFWAMMIIKGSSMVDLEILGYIVAGVVSFMMCIQAKSKLLNYIPGTFIGSCAIIAADGNWQLVIPSLLVGSLFGYLMKASGLRLHSQLTEKRPIANTDDLVSVQKA